MGLASFIGRIKADGTSLFHGRYRGEWYLGGHTAAFPILATYLPSRMERFQLPR